MSFVIFVNGLLLVGMGALMSLIGVIYPETRGIFLEAAFLTAFTGTALCLSSASRLGHLRRGHSFVLTASAWIVAATAGAFPLWLWHMSATDAFFEAMSGITTTGSTVMTGLDTTAPGILLWRAVLQWLGGVGFIVVGIALLPFMRVGGMQLFRTESSERGDKEFATAARFAGATAWIYFALTGLATTAYAAGGMTWFEAIVHAFTTVSTGGYSTSDASFGHFDSAYLQWMGTLFMLAGSLPFAWYIRLLRKGRAPSEQVRSLIQMLATVIVVLTLWRIATSGTPVFETLREVAFNVVSVVTTTGFATTDYTTWGPFAVVVFFLLTTIGGCTGSTAGGAKMMRWIICLRSARNLIRQIRFRDGIFPLRYEGRLVDLDVLNGVVTFFVAYGGTIFVAAALLNFDGLDFSTAVSGAVTAVANVGPGMGDIIGPAGNFSSLPVASKWVLSFTMYVGRLEMLTIYVLASARFWSELV